jgi:hypothetical protein
MGVRETLAVKRWMLALAVGLGAAHLAMGVESQTTPSADAFVAAAYPANNFGGGGSLAVAGAGSPNGEFQILLRFDLAAARTSFDASFGAGQWTLSSASLTLTPVNPVNPLYNELAAGSFEAIWTANDGWTEGAGTPGFPGTTGVSFSTLVMLAGSSDQVMGTFAYNGLLNGATSYALTVGDGLRADAAAGESTTLRLAPASDTVAMLVYSRSNNLTANAPKLTLTAITQCAADFDGTPGLSIQDIFAFLNAWFAGESRADFDHLGGLAVQDIFAYLNAWFAGCP